ncbi:MAG TPA: hypothetical protein DCQ06_03375 [Myxococcales bacterium]|nr:hypothetical protein [Myxococcales bacterium]HAN30617.1 hypothetical protein [Myxococcales bacterium]
MKRIAALIIAIACAWTAVAPTEVDARGRWLKLRRKGVSSVIAAARDQVAPKLVYKRYERDVFEDAPDAGLAVEVARRPMKKGKSDLSIRFWDGKTLVAALAVVKGKMTVRHGKSAPTSAAAELFRNVPKLGVPLILWAPLDILANYRLKLEGEFQGTALFRLNVDYTSAKGWQPMKLGISKQSLMPTVSEVVDSKSMPTSRLLMMRPRQRQELIIAEKLRLRSMKRSKPLDFVLDVLEVGKSKRALFGVQALQAKTAKR